MIESYTKLAFAMSLHSDPEARDAGAAIAKLIAKCDALREAQIPLATLQWWRELVDANPADLAPRLDARIAAARAALK